MKEFDLDLNKDLALEQADSTDMPSRTSGDDVPEAPRKRPMRGLRKTAKKRSDYYY